MSHFRKTGNIRLLKNADVLLMKEDLKIKLEGDYTEIEVDYELKNKGERQKIQYGFPVDAYETRWYYGDPYPVFSKENDCIEYFIAYEEEKPLKISQWIVDSVYSVKPKDIGELEYHRKDEEYQIIRKWSAITLEFEKEEIKRLRIKYKIKNTLRDKIPGFRYIPRYTERHFTYDLKPSKNWGEGIVKEMKIEIDLTELGLEGIKYELSGIDKEETKKDKYKLIAENYNLNESKRIEIHYDNIPMKLSKYISTKKIGRRRIKGIKSSSHKKDEENLIDENLSTNWKGKGGDWIEIEFVENEKKPILGVLILNGNYSNKEDFEKDGKIEKIKILLDDNKWFNVEPWEGENGKKEINLPSSKYIDMAEEYMIGLSTIVADGGEFYGGCKKLRLEILGKEGVISEIYFIER